MANPSTQQLIDPLTEREMDVLRAMSEGMSNQQIANHLHIALATVKWYNGQIYSKLDVGNRHDAVEQAHMLGLLTQNIDQTPTTAHNLPQASTPFVGRTRELRDLHELLNQDSTRLVTIAAQGGMGKTRLALALGYHNLPHFPDGVYLIQLAPVEDESGVVNAMGNTLGLHHYDNTATMQANLVHYLQSQKMLLILDNFEHVLSAATVISEIIQSAPNVKILATSRERLRLRGEIVYPLLGLPTSNDDEAFELFIQSTLRIRPDYQVSDADAPHISKICCLVDGLPLGIELAAGWMDTLAPETIADEIENSLAILETDLLDVPERHRSIQATFAYTWDCLTESEQATMMSLSIFKGGFTQDAALTVALADIRRLRHLVNKSLLYHQDEGDRYNIHELLRQFCFDKLLAKGDYDDTLSAYMTYFADHAERQYQPMLTFQYEAFQIIQEDWDNLAYSWQKMLHYGRYDLMAKAHDSLYNFSSIRGHSYECVELFETAIAHLEAIDDRDLQLETLLANLVIRNADLLNGIATLAETKTALLYGIELAQALDTRSQSLLNGYVTLLYANHKDKDYDELKHYVDQLIAIAEELEAYPYIISAHNFLWYRTEFVSDTEAYQASLEYCYQLWLDYCIPVEEKLPVMRHVHGVDLLVNLGYIDQAKAVLMKQLKAYEQGVWLYGISGVRGQLMIFEFEEGHYEEYARHVTEVLSWHHRYGRDWQTIGCLSGINGHALYYMGDYERAIAYCIFVIEHPISVAMQVVEAQYIMTVCRENLSEEAFQRGLIYGRTLTFRQAYEEAIAYWSNIIETGQLPKT